MIDLATPLTEADLKVIEAEWGVGWEDPSGLTWADVLSGEALGDALVQVSEWNDRPSEYIHHFDLDREQANDLLDKMTTWFVGVVAAHNLDNDWTPPVACSAIREAIEYWTAEYDGTGHDEAEVDGALSALYDLLGETPPERD